MNVLQEKEFNILIELEKIFKRHNLRYFAIGGTCIGAIRHGGFIPWDDDIDIAMPRKDFEMFRTKYYKELPYDYQKLDCDNCKSHNFLFMKIYDSKSTYVENYAKHTPERYTGAFVDIMPVDGLPDKNMKRHILRIDLLFRLNGWRRPVSRNGSFYEKVKDLVEFLVLGTFKYNFFSEQLSKIVFRIDYDASSKVCFTWRGPEVADKRRIFDKKIFQSTIEVPFETGTVPVPKEYDKYLSQDFGDYMQLPPKEEQKTVHNVYICDMARPCSYYAELERKKKKHL